METKKYEELIEKIYRSFEAKNVDEVELFVHPDVIIHTPDLNIPADIKGIEYFKAQLRLYTGAFPNLRIDIKDIFVKEDKGMAFIKVNGKNTGELNGMAPTNRSISVDLCEMFKFKDGKISEYWSVYDNLSFMMQLGLITEEELERKMLY